MKIHYIRSMRSVSKYTRREGPGAIPKLERDLVKYYQEIGVHILDLFSYYWDDEPQAQLDARVDGVFSGIKQGDIIIFPVPMTYNSERYLQTLFNRAKNVFGAKIVALTFDLTSFRLSIEDAKARNFMNYFNHWSQMEQKFLVQCDAIITQSGEMAQAIKDNFSFDGKIVIHGPWGFKTELIEKTKEKNSRVIFAGSPGKAQYLEELAKASDTLFSFYGDFSLKQGIIETPNLDDGWTKEKLANVKFPGQFNSEVIGGQLDGGFGLIWDSTTYPNVTGAFGQYMAMAYPHKFSLYTAFGIPSIVWKNSVLVPIVKSRKIGWIIDSLDEIPDLIKSISEEEYRQTTQNLEPLSELIRYGYFEKLAISNLMGVLNGQPETEIMFDHHFTIGYQNMKIERE